MTRSKKEDELRKKEREIKEAEEANNRTLAKKIYIAHAGDIKLTSIAKQLGVPASNIRKWKLRDKWDDEPAILPKIEVYEKEGVLAERRRKSQVELEDPMTVLESPVVFEHSERRVSDGDNTWVKTEAVSGPHNNGFATSHALYAKNIPTDTISIFEQIDDQRFSPLEILWEQITILRAIQIRSFKLMHVENREEIIRELKKVKYDLIPIVVDDKEVFEQKETEAEYEFQFAWDRQATFVDVLVKISTSLTQLITQYEKMIRLGWGDEEQALRIKLLKHQVQKEKQETQPKQIYIRTDYGDPVTPVRADYGVGDDE